MELTIDTASPMAAVALARDGALLAELRWRSTRGHAAELLPAIDRLVSQAGARLPEVRVIFPCLGPGGYAGLRAGISAAMALAFALDADVLGYGRLEAEAAPYLSAGHPVCAVHDAGRGQYAWGIYHGSANPPEEVTAPTISSPEQIVAALPARCVLVGEVTEPLASLVSGNTAVRVGADLGISRAVTAAALLWPRYHSGARSNRLVVTPLYLRDPHITQSRAQRAATEGAARADGANPHPDQT